METRNCQNCKKDFTIEQEDFSFYEKIQVPTPTWCPECRQQRRYAWRNERTLFKINCDNCKKMIFSAYPPERTYPVFCHGCWFSDSWNPIDFGHDYDFSKPFFVQFKELLDRVPRINLFQMNSTNSQYSNIIRDCKNTYLSYSAVACEDTYYSKNVDRSRHIYDCLCANDNERCYGLVYGANNYNVIWSVIVRSCLNSYFLYDCIGCSDCFMSSNIRNKSYVFRNKQYSKEEYEALMNTINLSSFSIFSSLVDEFEKMKVSSIHKYADIIKCVNSTGNSLNNAKNANCCFESYNIENVSYLNRCFEIKDSMDVSNTGLGSELAYEYTSGGAKLNRVFFSIAALNAISDTYYSGWCGNASNLFGCFGIRGKSYCILNKQYSEQDYKKLLPKIIEHMTHVPYEGKNGRVYKYGEFFPIEISPFAYNESDSQEFKPLSPDAILSKGYNFRLSDHKNYTITKLSTDLPDLVEEDDSILNEIIGCGHNGECLHQCTAAFKIVAEELNFYRQMNIPLPRLCPNCRHSKRLEYRNPWKLWHRSCMCEEGSHGHSGKCQNEFETSYAPERQEIIYCESCYQKEVI